MTVGFKNGADFAPVIGWELYQVTLDKYHIMFLFENGWGLLNIAHSFSHRSADGTVDYTFEIYGGRKRLELDRLLRVAVTAVEVRAHDRLALRFANGDDLLVHDDPDMCSWWFMRTRSDAIPPPAQHVWGIGDAEPD